MEQGNNALQVIENEKPVLFDTKTPAGVIDRATMIANTLAPLVEKAHLYSMISNRKYVTVDGWNTMLSMLGVFPSVEYSRKLERENETAYEARVNLTTLEGRVVGSGEAICSSKERNWSGRDEFAIKSMAQTRATGKAARIGFSWIMKLAGYEPTPAEEMIHEDEIRQAPKPTLQTKVQATGLQTIQSIFDLPREFTTKQGKPFWKTLDGEGVNYFIFDSVIAEYMKQKAGNLMSADVEYTAKGNRIVGFREISDGATSEA